MKRKILLCCIMLLAVLVSPVVMAQDDYYRPDSIGKEKPVDRDVPPIEKKQIEDKKDVDFSQLPFKDRLRIGGSFGLSFGTVTNVNLSPMIGYELNPKLVGGVGATLMYFRYRYYDINAAYYGGRAFLMYNVIPIINIIGEFETMNVVGSYQKRQWIGSPLLGASYSQPIGGRFIKQVHFTALYNLNYNNQIDQYSGQNLSPYGSPFVFRITFL